MHYLLSVYIPLALERDPTFGLAVPRLKAAISDLFGRDGDPHLRTVCESTLCTLEGAPGD